MKVVEPVLIYTDGSCLSNPGGKGGWAAVFQYKGVRKVLYGAEHSTTNNRMELMGPIEALRHLRWTCQVVLHSDSKYVINGITKWVHGWEKNGWKTRNREPVKNIEHWQMLVFEAKRHNMFWHWVRGHSGVELNEIADYFATKAAFEQSQMTLETITDVDFEFLKERKR